MTPADWSTKAEVYRGQIGKRLGFSCPPVTGHASVWGSDVYTDDSSICTAAVHAGAIDDRGGDVVIEIRPGEQVYAGTARNGITTFGYGPWAGSFVFPEAAGAAPGTPMIAWTVTADAYRARNGEQFTFTCGANGTPAQVWGTDVYTDDSSICTAAVHAGVIDAALGGDVTIEIRPGEASYAGTTRNSISTQPYGAWKGSYVFVR
jgi:hypothetical protein